MFIENKNPNYCATIVKVNTLIDLEGMDNCFGVPMFGYQVISRKGTINPGQLCVLFTAETQLSENFCKANNLYSSASLNEDVTIKGYIQDSGRVRSVKLRGHRSDALLLSLDCLGYLEGVDVNQLKEHDSFTHIDGVEVCRKYVVKQKEGSGGKNKNPNGQMVTKYRIQPKLIPEHVDTSHWGKNEHTVGDKEWIIVTQKLEGTSFRGANQLCSKPLTTGQKWAKWFGVEVNDKEYDYFACSRRVIKDTKRPDAHIMCHFYKMDIYNQCMDMIKHLIPKGVVVYGEIIGWSGDTPIQKNYTYNLPQGSFDLYLYRIASVNEDGISVDWAWGQIKEFCTVTGLKHVPELWQGEKGKFNAEVYLDKNYYKAGLTQCVPLSDPDTVDEGFVCRINGLTPKFLKGKSPIYLGHATQMLDEGVLDMESVEADTGE